MGRVDLHMAVSNEEYQKKMQEVVYTDSPKDIFSLIYNYKVELKTDNKKAEEKIKEELSQRIPEPKKISKRKQLVLKNIEI